MDADSSFIVTKVIPALSVPSGSVQEWAPGTQTGDSVSRGQLLRAVTMTHRVQCSRLRERRVNSLATWALCLSAKV